jgi:hypothetical protein
MALDMFGWTKPKRTRRASVAALTVLIYICAACTPMENNRLLELQSFDEGKTPAASASDDISARTSGVAICPRGNGRGQFDLLSAAGSADASSLQVIDAAVDMRLHSLQACRVKHCTIVGDRVFRRLSLQIAAPLAAPNSSPRPVQPIGMKAAVANYPLWTISRPSCRPLVLARRCGK